MRGRLIDALQTNRDVTAWTLRETVVREHQRYMVGERVETARDVSKHDFLMTVHCERKLDDRVALGTATMTVGTDDRSSAGEAVALAVRMASVADNRPYRLPEPGVYPPVETADARIAEGGRDAADELQDELLAAVRRERDVKLSSSEFFVEDAQSRLTTSAGVQVEHRYTEVFWELVLLAGVGSDEAEAYHDVRMRRVSDVCVGEHVARIARNALDAARATAPSDGERPVAVAGMDVEEIYSPFLYQAGGAAHFHRLARVKPGESVYGGATLDGDALTITSDGLMPYGVMTAPCDGEGLPSRAVTFVADGRLVALMCEKRYADYLGVEATGDVRNFVVTPGEKSKDDLLVPGTLVVVHFSDFEPDNFTGDITAEVRLGYVVNADGTRTPVKGGAVAGNLFSAMAGARLSSERTFFGRALVPSLVWFPRLHVSGG